MEFTSLCTWWTNSCQSQVQCALDQSDAGTQRPLWGCGWTTGCLFDWFHKQGFRGFKGEKGEPGLPGLDGLDAPCAVVCCCLSLSLFRMLPAVLKRMLQHSPFGMKNKWRIEQKKSLHGISALISWTLLNLQTFKGSWIQKLQVLKLYLPQQRLMKYSICNICINISQLANVWIR